MSNPPFAYLNPIKGAQLKLEVERLDDPGVRPTAIVSYNHLGNNDGMNLSAPQTFRSKEISKSNVVDDMAGGLLSISTRPTLNRRTTVPNSGRLRGRGSMLIRWSGGRSATTNRVRSSVRAFTLKVSYAPISVRVLVLNHPAAR